MFAVFALGPDDVLQRMVTAISEIRRHPGTTILQTSLTGSPGRFVQAYFPVGLRFSAYDIQAPREVVRHCLSAAELQSKSYATGNTLEEAVVNLALADEQIVRHLQETIKRTGEAFQTVGAAAAEFVRGVQAFSHALTNTGTPSGYPTWFQEGIWVNNHQTQRRAFVRQLRTMSVLLEGYPEDFGVDAPISQILSRAEALECLEPCPEPKPRRARWASLDFD